MNLTAIRTMSRRRGALTVAAVASVAALASTAGAGLTATMSDFEASRTTAVAGTVDLTLAGESAFNASVGPIAAGQSAYRQLQLRNAGKTTFKGVRTDMVATGTAATAVVVDSKTYGGKRLNDGGVNSLQFSMEACTMPWENVPTAVEGSAAQTTPTCAGDRTSLINANPTPVNGATTTLNSAYTSPVFDLAGSNAQPGGESVYLLLKYAMPSAADTGYQGGGVSFAYTFRSVQRDPAARTV